MSWTLGIIGVAALVTSLVFVLRMNRLRSQRELEQHSITAEELHALLASNQEVLLFDVRQPLDLLAYPEIIPKAQRVAPNEVLERPSLIPKEKDAVVYCTCPSDKTSRTVLRRALALRFFRVKFLKGGLSAWKAKGYPVIVQMLGWLRAEAARASRRRRSSACMGFRTAAIGRGTRQDSYLDLPAGGKACSVRCRSQRSIKGGSTHR